VADYVENMVLTIALGERNPVLKVNGWDRALMTSYDDGGAERRTKTYLDCADAFAFSDHGDPPANTARDETM